MSWTSIVKNMVEQKLVEQKLENDKQNTEQKVVLLPFSVACDYYYVNNNLSLEDITDDKYLTHHYNGSHYFKPFDSGYCLGKYYVGKFQTSTYKSRKYCYYNNDTPKFRQELIEDITQGLSIYLSQFGYKIDDKSNVAFLKIFNCNASVYKYNREYSICCHASLKYLREALSHNFINDISGLIIDYIILDNQTFSNRRRWN